MSKLHIVDNNTLHYFEDDNFDAQRTRADFFAPAISTSVFETREEAFEYILKQAELRVIYHEEQSLVYRSLHNMVVKEYNNLKEE